METPANKLTVAKFMTQQPCTVDCDLMIADARERMSINNIRHLLAVRGDRLVGVVSTRDLDFATTLPGIDPKKVPISVAMTPDVYAVDVSTPIETVAKEMETHRYGCAVVTEGEIAVGIFTTTDALRALRQVVLGHDVERAVQPQHEKHRATSDERHAEHLMRVSDALFQSGSYPIASHGTIR